GPTRRERHQSPRPLPGPPLRRLVRPHHPGHGRRRVPGRHPRPALVTVATTPTSPSPRYPLPQTTRTTVSNKIRLQYQPRVNSASMSGPKVRTSCCPCTVWQESDDDAIWPFDPMCFSCGSAPVSRLQVRLEMFLMRTVSWYG